MSNEDDTAWQQPGVVYFNYVIFEISESMLIATLNLN